MTGANDGDLIDFVPGFLRSTITAGDINKRQRIRARGSNAVQILICT